MSKIIETQCPYCGRIIVDEVGDIRFRCPHCNRDFPDYMVEKKIENEIKKAIGEVTP